MHTFCNGTVAGINCMLCLEMFYLFWLSPHTSFTTSLPCYFFTHFTGFVASQGLFRPINDRVYEVYLILREAKLWVNTWGSPSDLPVRQGGLQKTAEWRDAPSAPEGIQATTGLLCSFRRWIALLEGVADCEWLLESLRDQSQWLRKL